MSDHDQSASSQLYQRALKVLPGGVSRNAVIRRPHPSYVAKGEGCYVTDIDGNRRLDFANNMAALIHGHCHPAIIEAVTAQLHRGTAFTLATEVEVDFAEHLCGRSKGFEKIRFVNSGSEAVMCCLKAARAFTGRPKIAKLEGAYHGIYDYAEASQTAQPSNWGDVDAPESVAVAQGTPRGALDDVVIIPFNQPERARAILDRHAKDLACVLIDPLPHRVALVPATAAFFNMLRQWTWDNNVLLVFDEVITFRCEYGGCQTWFDFMPDLTALGKMIGGGFPVGAITGRADVMDVLNPLNSNVLFPHSGTFSANPVTMVAGLTAMKLFDNDQVNRLNCLGDSARKKIGQVIRDCDIPACVTGAGSMFRIHLKPEPPGNYRESYAAPAEQQVIRDMVDYLFNNGIMMIGTLSGTISTPMTEHEIDRLTETLAMAFRHVRPSLMQAIQSNQPMETFS